MRPFKSAGRESGAGKLQRAKIAAKVRVVRARSYLAQAYYARTPVGKAEAAHERGDSRFLIELAVGDRTMRTVENIEALGWQLEGVDYVSTPVIDTDNGRSSGSTTGVYLFTRGSNAG